MMQVTDHQMALVVGLLISNPHHFSCFALSCLLLGIVGWVNLMIESFPFIVSVTICCLLDAYLDDCPILRTFAEKYIDLMIYYSSFLVEIVVHFLMGLTNGRLPCTCTNQW
jgi:hypothetical protein